MLGRIPFRAPFKPSNKKGSIWLGVKGFRGARSDFRILMRRHGPGSVGQSGVRNLIRLSSTR